ncbi:hypothetical protein HJFPF1_07917 [Paramyrothecium foliicola]|nr:hypothetical protein HJFPF1_07917 [Paramyrothecium foliicola]
MAESQPPHLQVEEDDDVSVTSTIADEGEVEVVVDKVLAEQTIDGKRLYLVEWQGQPLSEAEWIPRDELVDEAVVAWELRKIDPGHGAASKLKLEEWRRAAIQFVTGKFARREARNNKRQRLGLPQTEYEANLDDILALINHYRIVDDEDAGRTKGALSETIETLVSASGDPAPMSVDRGHSPSPRAIPPSTDQVLVDVEDMQALANTWKYLAEPDSSENLAKSAQESTEPSAAGPAVSKTLKRRIVVDAEDSKAKRLRLLIPDQSNAANTTQPGRGGISVSEDETSRSGSASTEETASPASYLRASPSALGKPPGEITPSILRAASSVKGKKKKKSVRWVDVPEENGTDRRKKEDSLFVTDDRRDPDKDRDLDIDGTVRQAAEKGTIQSDAPRNLETSEIELCLRDRFQPDVNARKKKCILDTKTRGPITLVFDGIARHPDAGWLSDFESIEVMTFTHTCPAADFNHYDSSLSLREGGNNLIAGGIYSLSDSEYIRKRADLMRIGELGWLSHQERYCVLVFPSLSEGWKVISQNETAGLMHFPLQYCIFKPTFALDSRFLTPISYTRSPEETNLFLGAEKADNTERPFGPYYQDLIPWGQKRVIHRFFLAFPEARASEAALISQWLRDSNPVCEINTSLTPGQWSYFSQQENGILVLHEDAATSIRRIPGLQKLLHRQSLQHSFWIFTRHLKPLFSSPTLSDQPADYGRMRLQRIFTQGIAICVTPSFLLSQPEQAYQLLKWFWRPFFTERDISYPGKLVVCAGIDHWLLDLIVEKTLFRQKSRRFSPHELSVKGIHDEGMEARSKSWKLLQKLVAASTEDVDGPLVFAPESIDGNDEQSLVNWFGWWSLMNADKFRKFSVVGSNDGNRERLGRQVKAPKYIPQTINDPEFCYDEHITPQPSKPDEQTQAQAHGAPVRKDSLSSQASLVSNNRHDTIESYLVQVLNHIQEKRCPVRFFKKPVSYWNSEMPFHFGDYYSAEYQSYRAFLEFQPPFSSIANTRRKEYNSTGHLFTTMGFFYTLNVKWDPKKVPKDTQLARHPWIAIHRPTNAFFKPWKETELLIWDVASYGRFSKDDDVYEADLNEGQCKLIEAIKDDVRNVDYPLTKVWLGGYDMQPTKYTNALDITLDQLDKFADDIHTRAPLPQDKMAIRGWLAVKPGRAPLGSQPTSAPGTNSLARLHSPSSTTNSTEEDSAVLKMIFHPPRRPAGQPARPSNCTNRLFAWATTKHGPRNKFDHTLYWFLPTMEWYSKQVAEKRGFEHIKVTSWESIFETYQIKDPKKDRVVNEDRPSIMD